MVCTSRFGCALVVLWAVFGREAPASAQTEQSEVTRLRDLALGSEAPHAVLKQLFSQWDQSDPDVVEQALLDAEGKLSAKTGAKAYASLLLSEARVRRGDRPSAAARVEKLGYARSWLFVGPFDDTGRVGIGTPFQPESELTAPIVFGRSFDGKERAVRWRAAPQDPGVVFDFGDWVRPREEMCGYATSFLKLTGANEKSDRAVSLWMGWEGAFKLWWNDTEVLQDVAHRSFDFDRSAAVVTMKSGWNRVTVKVCATGSAKFSMRVADDKGEPIAFEASSDAALSENAAPANTKPAKAEAKPTATFGKAAPSKPSLQGPLQRFNDLTSGTTPRAADLEAYARYLVATGGNVLGEHKARDLAIRAAELEPTWERHLLGAELSEDRNQAARRLDLAEKLAVGKRRGELAVLLMRAALLRSSVNFRDATPLYEEALKLDPNNMIATLGRAELFIEAGLPRTAIEILETAKKRAPRKLALLKVLATQQRAVGRDAEADATLARWFAFHADDAAFLSTQVDKAIASDDKVSAEAWLDRLLETEPDLAFGRMLAARAYRSMGMTAKAKASLEAALAAAPEETGALRILADIAGDAGDTKDQLRFLNQILKQNPQDKDTREYVELLAPQKPQADEAFAWDAATIAEKAKSGFGKGGRMRFLRKLSVSTVFENGLSNRFNQVVFQPLTDEAAAEARQYFTSYEGSRQAIDLRLARVYRADGSTAESIESGEGAANNPAIAMYTSVRTFFVTFPRISAGDIVEVRYRVDDVALKNDLKDEYHEAEFVSERDPILSAEFILVSPKAKDLTTFVANVPGMKVDTKEEAGTLTRTFKVEELAGIPPESNQAPASEIAGQIHVSSFKTWDEVGTFYWNLSKDQFDVDEEVRKVTDEIAKKHTTPRDRVNAVYHYATALRYVALEFGIEGIKPRRCALTLARGWGDCKDKATLIVTMLRELGIDSTIVLVRTSMRGDLPIGTPPSLGAFDHAIAYVPSLDLYLDGTAEGSGSDELPGMDRGAIALQINQGKAKLVRLPNPGPLASPHERRFEVALAADGSAVFGVTSSVRGVNAPAWRTRYASQGTRRERATQDLTEFLGPVELTKDGVTIKHAADVEQPFHLAAKGRASAFARRDGETLSVNVASSLEFGRGLVAASTRQTDLILGPTSQSTEQRAFRLPTGASVVRLPENKKIETEFGTVTVVVSSEAGKVTVESFLSLKKTIVSASDYKAFREFCLLADDALSQRLVWKP